jgi:hypothetical protein
MPNIVQTIDRMLVAIFYPTDPMVMVNRFNAGFTWTEVEYDIECAFFIVPEVNWLEKIFAVFNHEAEWPENWEHYWGKDVEDVRSMMIGDVVSVSNINIITHIPEDHYTGGSGRTYRCMPSGWKVVPNDEDLLLKED